MVRVLVTHDNGACLSKGARGFIGRVHALAEDAVANVGQRRLKEA